MLLPASPSFSNIVLLLLRARSRAGLLVTLPRIDCPSKLSDRCACFSKLVLLELPRVERVNQAMVELIAAGGIS